MDESDYRPRLEHRICAEFRGFADEHLRSFWCDGLVPEEYNLPPEEHDIRGQAWCGPTGQEPWTFRLLVHPDTRSREGIDWSALLPDDELTGWLSPDPRHQTMTIDPLNGYPS
jgi:hypothetical protein